MKHVLKTHPAMFKALREGTKNFEVRKDDRAFQTGDIVVLKYYDPNPTSAIPVPPWSANESANEVEDQIDKSPIVKRITFVLRGGQYGIEPGYVVLALENHKVENND